MTDPHQSRTRRELLQSAAAFSLGLGGLIAPRARAGNSLRIGEPAPPATLVALLSASEVPGYGRIWRIPVSFTIDRAGHLADDGWKDRHPVWTPERLERVVAPLLS